VDDAVQTDETEQTAGYVRIPQNSKNKRCASRALES
jgi:hypothetical protein